MRKFNHARVEVSQAVVLQRQDGKILLLEDFQGRWCLPGGRLEEGEAWLVGLQREVREETGIEKFDLDGIIDVYQRVTNSSGQPVYGVIFKGRTSDTTVMLSHEHKNHRWVGTMEDCADRVFFIAQFEKALLNLF
ncbi:NUDIX hydrolase [Candidatus Dependentiae bacterium]|nr:NUDIX hydrolase [Candidatus Dependentiae bacterium]